MLATRGNDPFASAKAAENLHSEPAIFIARVETCKRQGRSIDSPQPVRYRERMPKLSTQQAPEPGEPNAVAQFEQSLDELEQVVAKMEGGELNLDESLRSFERGIALYRSCQAALEQAEARVKLLLDPEHPETAQPFTPPEER